MNNTDNTKRAATLGLVRKMAREGWLITMSGYEAFEQGCDFVATSYPELDQNDIEYCVSYAMQCLCPKEAV
jgi:hypothetical protein